MRWQPIEEVEERTYAPSSTLEKRCPMRFGIYEETQCPPEKPHYDLTWEIVRQIIHADAVGFDSYSVIEHHFFP